MARLLTVVRPPLGELLVTAKRNKSHVFGSSIASMNCFVLKCLFSMPVLFDLTRMIARTLSSSDKNLAFTGDPGKSKASSIPQANVIAPQIRKMSLQLSSEECIWPMPKLEIPEMT